MKTWTIGKRILFGFALMSFLLAGVACASFFLLNSVKSQLSLLLSDGLAGVTSAGGILNNTADSQVNVLRHLLASTPEERKALDAEIGKLKTHNDRTIADYEKTITQPADRELFEQFKSARETYLKARDPVLSLSREGKQTEAVQLSATSLRPAYDAYEAKSEALFDLNEKQSARYAESSTRTANLANTIILSASLTAMVLGVLLAAAIIRGLSQVLSELAALLKEGSAQVAAASSQVAASSQILAEGASEQAASLEETSSSLEEIASMTKRNADNAETAKNLAGETRAAADAGAADMDAMDKAMGGIKAASDNISKIIKTIDEIAFQTNILALNAAVEAARAGEAGMGFAVVADEVRNLAQRSAVAAKETAEKIEDSIKKSVEGVEISAKVATSLGEIVTKARKVNELVAEIASASKEQSQGITQVNCAVGQMDKITQSNAASAEEGASAAEELNAQAAAMTEAVGQLIQLVGGHAGETNAHVPAMEQHLPMPPAAPVRIATKTTTPDANGDEHESVQTLVLGNGRPESAKSKDLLFQDF